MEGQSCPLPYDILLVLIRAVDLETLKTFSLLNRDLYNSVQWVLWRSCRIVIDSSVFNSWLESGQEKVPPPISVICDSHRAASIQRLAVDVRALTMELISRGPGHLPDLIAAFLDVVRTKLSFLSNLRHLSILTSAHQYIMDAFLNDYSPIGGYTPSLLYGPHRHTAKEPFWLQHPGISSVELFCPMSADKLVTGALKNLRYLVASHPCSLSMVSGRLVKAVAIHNEDGHPWASTCEHLLESTGPLVALRITSIEISPSIKCFQLCIAKLKTLRELQIFQFAYASDSDRRAAMEILSTLPNLTVLLWRSTWEEITPLWQLLDETMSTSTREQHRCFAALRYVAFGAPSSINLARVRTNVETADGPQTTVMSWPRTDLAAGEALGIRLELDHLPCSQ